MNPDNRSLEIKKAIELYRSQRKDKSLSDDLYLNASKEIIEFYCKAVENNEKVSEYTKSVEDRTH